MDSFWTSKIPIRGLRHFVLLNAIRGKGRLNFLMVSVLDAEINLKISYEELVNSGNWERGWLNLNKGESITEKYVQHKARNEEELISKIFISDDSLFNIS